MIDARTATDSPNLQESHRYETVLNVSETTIGPATSGGAQVRITLEPILQREDGVEIAPSPATTMDLETDRQGRVRKILKSSLPPSAAEAFELDRLFSEARPILPSFPVGIRDTWDAPLKNESERSKIVLTGTGTLRGFRLERGRRMGLIEIRRSGTLSTVQPVGRAQVVLPARAHVTLEASIDVDEGTVVGSKTQWVSNFDLSAAGGGLAGKLKVLVTTLVVPRA